MADAPLKPGRARRKLRVLGLVFGLGLISTAAYAAYPVIDAEAIARMKDQLSKMQEQVDALKEHTEWFTTMSQQLQDQIDAIGALGQISLPTLNLDRLRQNVVGNIQCLKPDLDSLMPGINPNELDFGSICDGRQVYEKVLWLDPSKVGEDTEGDDPITWRSKADARKVVEARREALTKKTVSEGLAQGDLAATKQAEANERAVEELQSATEAATNQNTRLAAIAQGQLLTNRQLVQQNQLMARLVKIQATMLLRMTQPVTEPPATPDETEE